MTSAKKACILLLAFCLAGCGPKRPTYEEAVQAYEAEVELLNRLKAERESLGRQRRAEQDEQKKRQIETEEDQAYNEIGLQQKQVEAAKKIVDDLKG